jgi:hypothetical protein
MISAEWVDRRVGEAADSDTLVRCHGFMDRHGSQWTDADLNGPTRIAMDRRGPCRRRRRLRRQRTRCVIYPRWLLTHRLRRNAPRPSSHIHALRRLHGSTRLCRRRRRLRRQRTRCVIYPRWLLTHRLRRNAPQTELTHSCVATASWIDAVPVGDVGGYDGSERDVSFTPDGC